MPLDAETRGLISQAINHVFETQDFLDTINWILESDTQVSSKEDLALGYFLGALSNIAHNYVLVRLRDLKVEETRKRQMEKQLGKEKAKEARQRIKEDVEKVREEIRSKGGRPAKVEVKGKETEEIRSMLIPMFSSFRDKIRKEEALRKVRKR
jgi:hypothetical protein